ncbi:Myb_DNA-binding domain-containing protein [Cephalotus follicularis]|uniref:Myb_DNA-binding domain-containing protein n=1 Tax=Cephalotus follicularis TaxID=3775 RepID=A0A1Q3C296_CEPFO|nr:Myb_DNA-binding domain-containing protein [Cephalotus follicularis]
MEGTCDTVNSGGSGGGEIMLFGVRVVVDSMRKSVSLNDLSQYEHHPPQNDNNNNKEDLLSAAVAAGYASADDAVHNSTSSTRERKRGVPWTEKEHKLFLIGLQKVGKGDWRGISKNFVKSRTPTQVASHAQKYFLRRNNLNRRRRRSSLFDITTDTVASSPMEEEQVNYHQDNKATQLHSFPTPPLENSNISAFPVMPAFPLTSNPIVLPVPMENPMRNQTQGQGNPTNNAATKLVRPIPIIPAPHALTLSDLNLNLKSSMDPSPLSLKLSQPSDWKESSSRHSAFQVMSNFSTGDGNSVISVA